MNPQFAGGVTGVFRRPTRSRGEEGACQGVGTGVEYGGIGAFGEVVVGKKWLWYIKSQTGVLLFPLGLCLFGEALTRRIEGEPWFWWGTIALATINAGVGLMIESGLIGGFPRDRDDRGE